MRRRPATAASTSGQRSNSPDSAPHSGIPNPKLRKLLLEDLRRPGFSHTLRRDLRNLYLFYLDEERRQRLASMGRVRRFVTMLAWLLKGLILKLSPVRRLLLAASLILALVSPHPFQIGDTRIDLDMRFYGYALLLLLLMLELRDKLLARDEIEVARQVQMALLPRQDPTFPGWSIWSMTRPANDVGGDLIDYLEPEPGRLGVALGDVAGKGMGAALLMAKLQATLRAMVAGGRDLADLGARLNAILNRDGLENRYATLFYVELEPGASRLRFLNAGHNPPFVLRQGRVLRLEPMCLPLGMLGGAAYAEGSVSLEPGDMMLIYSDGLTEAFNAEEEEFGEPRLRSVLASLPGVPPREAGRRILQAVDDFVAGERPHDDLSLVLLRRNPTVEGGLL